MANASQTPLRRKDFGEWASLEIFDGAGELTVGGLATGVSRTVSVLEDSSLLVTWVAVSRGGSLAGFVSVSNS